MLISDYASVFFFARWNRVTLQRSSMHRTERSCNFKTEPDQRPPSSADAISECARANRNAMPSCSQLDTVKIRSRKNTVTQKYREWRPKNPAGKNSRASFRQRATMKVSSPETKKARLCRAFSRTYFRPVHFASLAIW